MVAPKSSHSEATRGKRARNDWFLTWMALTMATKRQFLCFLSSIGVEKKLRTSDMVGFDLVVALAAQRRISFKMHYKFHIIFLKLFHSECKNGNQSNKLMIIQSHSDPHWFQMKVFLA